MPPPQLFDATTIDTLPWPETSQSLYAKKFLPPLVKEGAHHFIKNVKTELFVLLLDDLIIPITVNNKEYSNSYVASSYCSVPYLAEKIKRNFPKTHPLFAPLLAPLKLFLKGVRINKMVLVNNWLFSTNLFPTLSQSQVNALTTFLIQRFPDHYLMFRSVHTLDQKGLFSSLQARGYRLIGSRRIFAFDPKKQSSFAKGAKRKIKKDIRLIEEGDYEVIDGKQLTPQQVPRILELYNAVYRDKYSSLSPHYSEKFLRHAIQNDLLKIKVIKKEKNLVGVIGYYSIGEILTDPFFGYDTSLPQELGIYRMTSILPIIEAKKLQKIAHVGSGGDKYKKWRGFDSQLEYIAVYDKHLKINRQMMWFLSEKLMNHLVMPVFAKK